MRRPADGCPAARPRPGPGRNKGRTVRAAVAGLLVGGFLVALATPASAHASLTETEPASGSANTEPPSAIVLRFSEPVSISLGAIRLLRAGGDEVELANPSTRDGGMRVRVALPALAEGSYAVAWRVVSDDAHPIRGAFTFGVGTAAPSAGAAADLNARLAGGGADDSVGVLFGAARFAAFAGLLVLVGGFTFLWLVWPAGTASVAGRRVLRAAWVTSLAATVAGIALQGPYVTGGSLAGSVDPAVIADVLDTRFGRVWSGRALALVLVVPFLARLGRAGARMPRPGWRVAGAAAGAWLLLTPGLGGHASTGDFVALAQAADLVHLAALAVWLGGLVLLCAAVLPGRDASTMSLVVPRFSRLALGAVAAVVVTGTFQAWRQVRSVDALTDTTYGKLLLVKLAVFAGLMALAALSRRLVQTRLRGRAMPAIPRLAGPGAMLAEPDTAVVSRLRRSVAAEVALAVVVVAVTAVLVNTVPARDAFGAPFATTLTADGLVIDVTVSPARVGPNLVHVYSFDGNGITLELPELQLSMSLPDRDFGPLPVNLQPAGPGHWTAAGFDIPLPGRWRIDITARPTEFDQTRLETTFDVSSRS